MHPGISTRIAIRGGLGLIAICTLAMGGDHHFAAWLILRGVAGLASALVMIAVSAWILPRLTNMARENLSGTVYAGVGAGIVYAGAACLVLLRLNASADTAWVLLGATAAIVTLAVWRVSATDPRRRRRVRLTIHIAQGPTSGWCSATAHMGWDTSSRRRSCR